MFDHFLMKIATLVQGILEDEINSFPHRTVVWGALKQIKLTNY